MRKRNFIRNHFFNTLFFIVGLSGGIILIWPGILSFDNRKCFFDILKDGSDGDIQLKTILAVKPNYLLKIKNARNKYFKVLLVGDSCFRNFS